MGCCSEKERENQTSDLKYYGDNGNNGASSNQNYLPYNQIEEKQNDDGNSNQRKKRKRSSLGDIDGDDGNNDNNNNHFNQDPSSLAQHHNPHDLFNQNHLQVLDHNHIPETNYLDHVQDYIQ